jgi:hypothetical protein
MESETTRELSQTSAERMRMVSEAARENAQLERDSELVELQERIEATAREQREAINNTVNRAANLGQNYASHQYIERISRHRNKQKLISFIIGVADITSEIIVESLKSDGFEVSTKTHEATDPRDGDNAPTEYYVTNFSVKW